MIDDVAIANLIESAIAALNQKIGAYLGGSGSWESFRAGIFKLLRDLYFEVGSIALSQKLTAAHRKVIEEALAEQFYPHGEDFSLTQKFEDKENGLISWGMFGLSLAMYMRSARAVAYKVRAVNDGDRLVVRQLGGNDHCAQCLLYSALGPVKFEDAILPGRECQCYTNCLCVLVEV